MSVFAAERNRSVEAADGRLAIRLLGGFEMRSRGRVHSLDKRKACAILAYLLLSGQARETRSRLSALLWSDSDEAHARASLRQSIRDLKLIEAEAGVLFLVIDKLSVGIDRDAFDSDVTDLARAFDTRDFSTVDALLSQGNGTVCAGLQDCDPVFDNWMATTAANWSDTIIARLSTCLDAPNLMFTERKALATAILRLDAFHEQAVMEMLNVLNRESGPSGAGAFFDRYCRDLRIELDLAPPRAMVRHMEHLRALTGRAAEEAALLPTVIDFPAPAAIDRPTIIIVTEKQRANDSHIQFALVSELVASLSRFRHWTAIQAELSHEALRAGPAQALRAESGHHADLAVVITASQDGANGHAFDISCHDLATDGLVFTLAASAEPSAWRAVFNDICARVASRLQAAISTARLHRIDTRSANYISAYDSWLDGQRLSILWQNTTEAAAIGRYEDAIRQDPKLACAYSSLAAVLNSRWIVLPGYPIDSADLERAFDLARKAVMLDPLDHRNQVNLAWSHLLAHRWDLADFHFNLAHDLNAANPATLIAFSLASAFMGHHDRAGDLSRRAFELNPLQQPHYDGYNATIAFLAGDLDGCIRSVERSDALFPDIRGWSAAAHALSGNDARAATDIRMFLRQVSDAWYGGARPERRAVIDWFKTVFPIRLDTDRARLCEGIDRAVRLA